MDFLSLATSVRKHWIISLLGVVAGVLLAVAVSYQPTWTSNRLVMESRSFTTYKTSFQLMITDPTYGLGRAGLTRDPDGYGKSLDTAQTFANLTTGDSVLRAVSTSVGPVAEYIEATPVKDTPIIKVTVEGSSADHVRAVARALPVELIRFVTGEQDTYKVPPSDRLQIVLLSSADTPRPVQSRSWEIPTLVFFGPVLLALGVVVVVSRAETIPRQDASQGLGA